MKRKTAIRYGCCFFLKTEKIAESASLRRHCRYIDKSWKKYRKKQVPFFENDVMMLLGKTQKKWSEMCL